MTMTRKIIAAIALAGATAGGVATMAQAQNAAVQQAVSQGVVGETMSGYLGFAQSPSAELRAQVDAINLARRSAYTRLAEERGVTRQQVATETACSVISGLAAGRAYQLQDGVWRTAGAGGVSVPGC